MDFPKFLSICIIITVLNAVEPETVSGTLECPADSALIDGQCECDITRCAKPSCDKVLNLATNGTESPGLCCPTYTCDLCSTDVIESGNCSCAVGAFINKYGKCKCSDPEKSVMDGECVCDENKCPLDHICDESSVKVMEVKGCCKVAKCIRCPLDSHPFNGGEEIEDKCVCFPCSKPECLEDEVPIYKRRGTNFPGTCCDLYECTKRTCLINGTTYSINETWQTETETCKCVNGVAICHQPPQEQHLMSCLNGDKFYPHLSTWVEDSCTNCTCFNGEAKCISHMCDFNVSQVCPPVDNCSHCQFGYKLKLNKNGCDVCKCKDSKLYDNKFRFMELAKLLKEHNLSEVDVIKIVDEYLRSEFNTTTATPPTPRLPGSSLIHNNNIIVTIFLCLSVLILIVSMIFCCLKNKHISYSPVTKKPIGQYELQQVLTEKIQY